MQSILKEVIIINNYVVYHLHSDYSLLDSCTKFSNYVDKAVELGQSAIASTEHGNIFNWIAKKMYCDKKGIKYIHGCEVYLTEKLFHERVNIKTGEKENYRIRDNYHTVLLAKNEIGVKELNSLISLSNQADHFYYKPRISFDEFLNISDNIIKISACLASPLNKLNNKIQLLLEEQIQSIQCMENITNLKNNFDKLLKHYDYYEIQYHNVTEQIKYNQLLLELSKKYNKPLIVGTDTHSLNKYKAECRLILQKAKAGTIFGTKKDSQQNKEVDFNVSESEFDLTYKSYNELLLMFKKQNSLPLEIILNAIENTNVMANSVENFNIDFSIKYPHMYEDDDNRLVNRISQMFQDKINKGIIPNEQIEKFKKDIEEEIRVFRKVDMMGFMLSMSEICCWAKENNHPLGNARGSSGGSRVAYITDIIDLNPIQWKTNFSRFCNEDRKEVGDYISWFPYIVIYSKKCRGLIYMRCVFDD